tara:strand:- start:1613 stop:3382 length:1770 start_codon:yes stop_codon:yes gene_type:complete
MNDDSHVLRGIPASPGIGIGKAFLYHAKTPTVSRRRVNRDRVAQEIHRFHTALLTVAEEIRRTKHLVEVEHGPDLAQIFEAQLAMLDDVQVKDNTIDLIRRKLLAAEPAFVEALRPFQAAFDEIENEYLRSRVADLQDIEHQVLFRLGGGRLHGLHSVRSNTIVIARDLLPSESVHLGRKLVKGLVLDHGGATSHATIIARSLQLPSVVGAESASSSIRSGDLLIVDGDEGVVYVRPDEEAVRFFQAELRRLHRRERDLRDRRDLPAKTKDGVGLAIMANVDLQQEVDLALENGATGVGMFRTEFLFMEHRLPSEEEQMRVYRQALEAMAPWPVVIRTFDLGGDKLAHAIGPVSERNPFLGWRGIRLCLDNPDLFKLQLRALLRAGVGGDLHILLPMITNLDELRKAKTLIKEVTSELDDDKLNYASTYKVGVMVEVPSVAITVEMFVQEVDFLSLGTNDLVQYTLAVDRGTPRVADLYDHYHPAVLKLIKEVADCGLRHGIPTSVCGEMAGDPLTATLLLGLGVKILSVSPGLIPELKEAIRATTLSRAQEVAQQCLSMDSGTRVRMRVEEAFSASSPSRRKRPRFKQ